MLITPQAAASSLTSYFTFKEQMPFRNSFQANKGKHSLSQKRHNISRKPRAEGKIVKSSQQSEGRSIIQQHHSNKASVMQTVSGKGSSFNVSVQDYVQAKHSRVNSAETRRKRSKRRTSNEVDYEIVQGESEIETPQDPPKMQEKEGRLNILDTQKHLDHALKSYPLKDSKLESTLSGGSSGQGSLNLTLLKNQTKTQPRNAKQIDQQPYSTTVRSNPAFHDTNQDMGLLSMGDQSDQKSGTHSSEIHLREENMQLRMEILKLKKALFMKADPYREGNKAGNYNPLQSSLELANKEISTLSSNYQEPPEDSQQYQFERKYIPYESSLRTPLSKVMAEDICEEASFHSNENVSAKDNTNHIQSARLGHVTFNRHDFLGRQHMSTVDEMKEETETKEHETQERCANNYFREHRDSLVNQEFVERNFDDRKVSEIFEKKRHYEQEIEVLKRDLELIELEEKRIKSKLFEKSIQDLYPSHSSNFERGLLKEKYPNNEIAIMRQERVSQNIEEEQRRQNIDIAFDSFIEKRVQADPLQEVIQKKDQSFPIRREVSYSNIENTENQRIWQPPSFCNSQLQSIRLSQVEGQEERIKRMQQQQASDSLGSQQEAPPSEQTFCRTRGRVRRSRASQQSKTQISNHGALQETHYQHDFEEGSGRLNTDMIDRIFEDPKVQSQFQCLDDQEPMIVSLLTENAKESSFKLHRLQETSIPNHNNEQYMRSDCEVPQFKSSQQIAPELKHGIKGVLQQFEQSYGYGGQQQHDQMQQLHRHYIGDGLRQSKESSALSKKDTGPARLSTIKEDDSPEFGTHHQFHPYDPTYSRSQLQGYPQLQGQKALKKPISNYNLQLNLNYIEQSQRLSGYQKKQPPSYDALSKLKVASKKSNKQNQLIGKSPLTSQQQSVAQIPIKKKKATYNLNQLDEKLSRSVSPYSIKAPQRISHPGYSTQMSTIVNRAYEDVLKRRSKEGSLLAQYSQTLIPSSQQIEGYCSKKQLKQAPGCKNKKNTKGKENYLSQQNQYPLASRNAAKDFINTSVQQNNRALNQKQTYLQPSSTSILTSNSFISKASQKARSYTRSKSKSQKRAKEVQEEQYDLLWSMQVVNKRNNIIKQREDRNKRKYEQKMAKIEEIQRRKSQEINERKQRQRSPTTMMPTIMSEFESTPYSHHNLQLDRYSGYNTLPVPSYVQSTSARTPKQPSTPIMIEVPQQYQNAYHPQKVDVKFPQTTNISLNISGYNTTNIVSLQNSSKKSIARTPDITLKKTPLSSNNFSDKQFDSGCVNASTYLSNSRPQPVYQHSYKSSSSGTAVVAANQPSTLLPRNGFQVLDQRSSHSMVSSSSIRQHSRSNSGVPKMNTEKRLKGASRIGRKNKLSYNSPLFLIQESDMMRQFLSQQEVSDFSQAVVGGPRQHVKNAPSAPTQQRQHSYERQQVRRLEPIVEDL
ncbi:hypothetical protein FGO68_gene810 [Halteria grandinella]|uniref:Uncharacterized protein n=1 Tax=Halteria grandinella TaxID=5974 RepID=A0A8J8TAJ6_HALGN|nr:hypothetical protein FGO68_gene810 [Halteria grandinella]